MPHSQTTNLLVEGDLKHIARLQTVYSKYKYGNQPKSIGRFKIPVSG